MIVGVCFGLQALAVIMGGEVRPIGDRWHLGADVVRFVRWKSWMRPIAGEMWVLFNHKEWVTRAPRVAQCLLKDEKGRSAMMTLGCNVIGVPFHPEYDRRYQRALWQCDGAATTHADRLAAYASHRHQVDHNIIRKWLWHYTWQRRGGTFDCYNPDSAEPQPELSSASYGRTMGETD